MRPPVAPSSGHFVILAFIIFLLCAPAAAGDLPEERASLKGVTAFAVVVEPISDQLSKAGLTTDYIKTDVELRLRKSGITVTPTASGMLYVNVYAREHRACSIYTLGMHVGFEQLVSLKRDPSISVPATTWSTDAVGTVGVENVRAVREAIGDLVDQFINVYLEQNPKK